MATRVAELSAVVTADTKGLTNGLNNAQSGLEKTATGMKALRGSLTEMNSGLSLAKQAFSAVSGAIHSVIDPTVEYAAQVRNLGRSIGATAEESSKLIQAADDVMVSVSSLEAGLNAAIRKGVEPTIEGLGKLADQYNAIQDPIARTKFLMDNFGRSGADLAPLMEQGAAGIKELGDQAELAGLVMSKDGVDSMRNYEKAIDATEDTVMSLKMAISKELVPAITGYLNTINDNISVQQRYNRALEAGALTQHDIAVIAAADMVNNQNVAKAVLENAEARMKLNAAMQASRDAFYSQIPVTNDAADAEEQAAKSANYWTREMWKAVDGANAVAKAGDAYALSLERQAENTAQLLSAGLAGKLQSAQQEYNDVLAETTPELARLSAEIEKYQRQQGTSITVTGEATTTVNEYELGALKAAEAQKKLAEFTGDDALELATLRVNADHAQEAVVKLGEGMGWSETTTADYTKALAEDSAAMAELVAKQEAAEAALRKATAEMVLQQVAADLGGAAATEFAFKTGLMSEADYTLTKAIQAATAASDIDRSGTIDSAAERAKLLDMTLKLTDQTADLATGTYTAAQNMSDLDSRLPPVATGLDAVTTSAGLARDGIDQIPHAVAVDTAPAVASLDAATGAANGVTTAMNNIPRTVTTDLYVNRHEQTQDGGGGHYASGGDFIVPPGFPHDSYMMNVQSGEHVTVVPAGGTAAGGNGSGGGTTYNFNFNNAAPITVPTALQTARATAGAW